jgi:hypothetical protein
MKIRGYARLRVSSSDSLIEALPESSVTELRAPIVRMDRLCGLSVAVVANLFAQFPTLLGEVPSDDVAIVLGSMLGCHKTDEEYYRSFLNGQPSPRLFASTLPSSPNGELSILYRLRGPGLTVTMGSTSGLCALAEAAMFLRMKQAAACLVVAVEVSHPALSSVPLVDSAVALWLTQDAAGSSLASVTASDESFHAGCAATAFGEVLAKSPASAVVVCDEKSAQIGAAALQNRHCRSISTPEGAVSGLWALGDALNGPEAAFVLAGVDDGGHAVSTFLTR